MKKLLIAALLCMPAAAFAQEQPPHGVEPEPHGGDETAAGPSHGTAHADADAHHAAPDPTKHFNWFGSPFGHTGKDVYGGKLGDGKMVDPHTGEVVIDPHTGNPAEEEPMSGAFIWMALNFLILLVILAKYGRPAARKVAEERHDQIKTALDEAAKLRDEAARKLAEYETKVKGLDAEVTKIVSDIRAAAEGDKQRILEAATAQAAQMKRDAEQRIAAEIEYARKSLQREVVLAAATATEKQLKDKMTGDDQTKLVTSFISNVQTKEAR